MFKFIALTLALAALAALAPPAQAQFVLSGDMFDGYIEGREAAIRANQRDALALALALANRRTIANDISAFNLSGDWRHLRHALSLGSIDAERHLFDNDTRRRFYQE
ncbi:MAG: hypothetical protein LBO66_10865 [Deltaproteobacteria bacterium]|jgi:hypothetical protein|nr:hypothetical protein [Deltaproteobacteria bacterium]